MKLPLLLPLTFLAVCSSAYKLTVKKMFSQPLHKRALSNGPSGLQLSVLDTQSDDNDISSIHDLIYIANISIGGTDYDVQLDTGSSDLFVKGASYPIPNTTTTTMALNLTYAIGWAAGHVAYAPVDFLGISVPSQAFLDASSVLNPAFSYGAQGIVGLGFTQLSSIDLLVNKSSQDTGRSLLYNLFNSNPQEPNFIAFSLQRSTDPNNTVEGTFSIGEYEPAYASVSGNSPIPTWPLHFPLRWNLLLDAVIVNETITVPTTNVLGAPSNKAVVLMDSGSSYTYAPKEICQAIYGSVPGAYYDPSIGYWSIPCGSEVTMALQIGGQVFPLNPLDVVPTTASDPSVCIGSFVPNTATLPDDIDWLIGDNFFRSVYAVYDFGDFNSQGEMGDPYMKLLSIIDPDQASVDFHDVWGGTPKTNITFVGLNGASIAPSFAISTDISESLNLIGKFVPAMLGIVALNTLILLICCIVWLVSFCRKRRLRATARTPRSRIHSMPMNPMNSYIAGAPPPAPHVYQPVSMALTEDTFVPPSPAFHSFEGKLQQGDRPKSVA